MSSQLPTPAGSNTFERIKRVSAEGNEFWSARDLARVLEYTDFRNFITVIAKAARARNAKSRIGRSPTTPVTS